ncbi:cytochrome c maturation protein CcmE domain-containing protein [Cesiribacter andamanensis]|uniref:Cytochrome c-type biogenesis protein CcmE n=1 Tax=Cesiribacter andamanensis AMV16 TaxID=1279009 RepID=M7N6V8_9BACT|nr:cytochrome c maturation protein CcmE [Cesiribacter andamanensis]EMR02971.1 cytochrome c-type biogenesis protein CcmE [Cesiribacter andamanensis AMV16]
MKFSHILGILVIAVAVIIIISTTGDASSYVNFEQAKAMAVNDSREIHVVGTLKKDPQGHVVGISPSPDKLSFSFLMVDEQGREQLVRYNEPMPPDFLRSEQVVVIGRYQGNSFVAKQILLKCPSKYQENELQPTSQQAQFQ